MRIKAVLGLSVTLLLASCSSNHHLTSAGEKVTFSEVKPAVNCQLLGQVIATQSNWLSGTQNQGGSMRSVANDLRNKAAAMGGNVIFDVTSPSQNLLSQFVPLDSKMSGFVYKCP